MRCGRAQQWMTAGEGLTPRRRRALERHVAECPACQTERGLGARLETALTALPHETTVPAALEQATFRAVRLAAAAEGERPARSLAWWWIGVSVPALAGAAAIVLAVGVYRRSSPEHRPSQVAAAGRGDARGAGALRVDAEPTSGLKGASEPATVAVRARSLRPALDEPPPDLAAMPERFIDLPVLRNLDKLRHYEAITGVDDDITDPGQAPQSDG